MTAGPHQYRTPATAWFVHTDQGVVLGGPYADEPTARTEGNRIAAELRAGMRRAHRPERDVAERVAALRVGYGYRVPPHGGFSPP